jgi:hypothetical protein
MWDGITCLRLLRNTPPGAEPRLLSASAQRNSLGITSYEIGQGGKTQVMYTDDIIGGRHVDIIKIDTGGFEAGVDNVRRVDKLQPLVVRATSTTDKRIASINARAAGEGLPVERMIRPMSRRVLCNLTSRTANCPD